MRTAAGLLLVALGALAWLARASAQERPARPPAPPAKSPADDPAALALLSQLRERLVARPLYVVGTLTVRRGRIERELLLRLYLRDAATSVVRIEGPPREDGTCALRKGGRLFLWLPRADLLLELPPTMGTDRLAGSDFAVDDLFALGGGGPGFAARFGEDETIDGVRCRRVVLTPRTASASLYGRVDLLVPEGGPAPRRMEFRSERGVLLRVVEATDATPSSPLPLTWTARTLGARPSESRFVVRFVERDPPVPDSFFTPQGLKWPR